MAAIAERPRAVGRCAEAGDDLAAEVFGWDDGVDHQVAGQSQQVDVLLVLGLLGLDELPALDRKSVV